MTNNELCHFGVKGMKWGVWNEETRQRYSNGFKNSRGYKAVKKAAPYVGRATAQTIKNGKDKPNISPLEKDIQETKKIMSTIRDMRSGRGGSKRVRRTGFKEPGELSNEDLRKYIERLNLEKSYDSLTMKDVKTGMDYADDILSIAGSVASIAAVTYMIIKK